MAHKHQLQQTLTCFSVIRISISYQYTPSVSQTLIVKDLVSGSVIFHIESTLDTITSLLSMLYLNI